ncbi:MAG: hypothetical protein HYX40_07975 [Sphingobacteriales bacterium]|nr:hypothetical protein [Sphingobacteriales bacterium]
MNINRNNYEEFLLLYADNELSFSERQAVEIFLESNPDLRAELQSLLDSKLHTEHVPFFNKAALYKSDSFITEENHESYFLLYADNELTAEESSETEKYAASSPVLQKEFELIQQTKLEADTKIVFADKSVLYKSEEPTRVIPIAWMRIAVAAAVIGIIFLAGFLWFNKKIGNTGSELVKKETPAENKTAGKNSPQQINPSVLPSNSEQTIAVVDDNIKTPADQNDKQQQQVINSKLLQPTIAVVNSNVKEIKKEKPTVTKLNEVSSSLTKADGRTVSELLNNASPNIAIVKNGAGNVDLKVSAPGQLKQIDNVDRAVGPEEINQYTKTAVNTEEEEENKTSFAVFPVTEDKVQKSGLRGLFRKVKRAISRRNSNDNNDQDSKKIYIGSFAIARAK